MHVFFIDYLCCLLNLGHFSRTQIFRVVVWRRANKVGVNVQVTPSADCEEAVFGLVLRYEYTNTVTTISDSRTVVLNIPVLINAGKVV